MGARQHFELKIKFHNFMMDFEDESNVLTWNVVGREGWCDLQRIMLELKEMPGVDIFG